MASVMSSSKSPSALYVREPIVPFHWCEGSSLKSLGVVARLARFNPFSLIYRLKFCPLVCVGVHKRDPPASSFLKNSLISLGKRFSRFRSYRQRPSLSTFSFLFLPLFFPERNNVSIIRYLYRAFLLHSFSLRLFVPSK